MTEMANLRFQFSLRTLLIAVLPVCVLVGIVFTPVNVRVPISASLIMNSVHYSEGLRINVYNGDHLVAGNCLIVSRKMEVESIELDVDEIDIEKIFLGAQKLPVPEDNSYLELRVNWIQKYRIESANNIRVGGQPLPQ